MSTKLMYTAVLCAFVALSACGKKNKKTTAGANNNNAAGASITNKAVSKLTLTQDAGDKNKFKIDASDIVEKAKTAEKGKVPACDLQLPQSGGYLTVAISGKEATLTPQGGSALKITKAAAVSGTDPIAALPGEWTAKETKADNQTNESKIQITAAGTTLTVNWTQTCSQKAAAPKAKKLKSSRR